MHFSFPLCILLIVSNTFTLCSVTLDGSRISKGLLDAVVLQRLDWCQPIYGQLQPFFFPFSFHFSWRVGCLPDSSASQPPLKSIMSGSGSKRAAGDGGSGPPEKKANREEKTTTTLIEPIRLGGISSTVRIWGGADFEDGVRIERWWPCDSWFLFCYVSRKKVFHYRFQWAR